MTLPRRLPVLKLALLGAALACLPITAGAQVRGEEVSVAIDLRGVDLSTPQGAKIAFARIRAATPEFCGPQPAVRQLAARRAHETCRRDFYARAVAAIDAPMVTATVQQRAPRS